jgi:hypothetical protein
MKSFHEYWSFVSVRGILALLGASVVVFLPRAIASLFELPVLLGFAIGAFALWAVFDAASSLLLAKLYPAATAGRRALVPQAAATFAIAILIFLTGYRVLPLAGFVWLAAALAAIAAGAEFSMANDSHRTYGCLSCYSTVFALAVAAVALPFCGGLGAADMTLALGAWLSLIGLSEVGLGSRMLFLGYRAEHPATPISMDWKDLLDGAVAPLPAALQKISSAACAPTLTCDVCPAEVRCTDGSLQGQLAAILSTRQPSIVKTVQAATLLQSAR